MTNSTAIANFLVLSLRAEGGVTITRDGDTTIPTNGFCVGKAGGIESLVIEGSDVTVEAIAAWVEALPAGVEFIGGWVASNPAINYGAPTWYIDAVDIFDRNGEGNFDAIFTEAGKRKEYAVFSLTSGCEYDVATYNATRSAGGTITDALAEANNSDLP